MVVNGLYAESWTARHATRPDLPPDPAWRPLVEAPGALSIPVVSDAQMRSP